MKKLDKKKKVIKHLKGDISTFKHEAQEDRELIKSLKGKFVAKKKPTTKKAKRVKVKKVMDEWQSGDLHSGSKTGPVVKSQKQAVAIALSEAGKSKKKAKKPKKK